MKTYNNEAFQWRGVMTERLRRQHRTGNVRSDKEKWVRKSKYQFLSNTHTQTHHEHSIAQLNLAGIMCYVIVLLLDIRFVTVTLMMRSP